MLKKISHAIKSLQRLTSITAQPYFVILLSQRYKRYTTLTNNYTIFKILNMKGTSDASNYNILLEK